MTSSLLSFIALILGLLSAIGPFAIDMYLPALPAIGQDAAADLTSRAAEPDGFFISFAVGQLVYGPVSDMFGRKPPLYVGIALFVVGSDRLRAVARYRHADRLPFRAGSRRRAPEVITRAVVRDLHTGAEAARLMSLLMLVFRSRRSSRR